MSPLNGLGVDSCKEASGIEIRLKARTFRSSQNFRKAKSWGWVSTDSAQSRLKDALLVSKVLGFKVDQVQLAMRRVAAPAVVKLLQVRKNLPLSNVPLKDIFVPIPSRPRSVEHGPRTATAHVKSPGNAQETLPSVR